MERENEEIKALFIMAPTKLDLVAVERERERGGREGESGSLFLSLSIEGNFNRGRPDIRTLES